MRELSIIEDGALLIENGRVTEVGTSRRIENLAIARRADEVDVTGKVVIPGFVDSHTHLVFGPPRLNDFELRAGGATYAEIAAAGGGILTSVKAVRATSTRRLVAKARHWLARMASQGTTTVEAKSGYGLDGPSEIKLLRAARLLHQRPLDIVNTLLGAHIVPPEFADRPDEFIDWLVRVLIPKVAARKLARFADVYCDDGAFSLPHAHRYMMAAAAHGFMLKMHASQWRDLGAVAMAVELGAVSVDHLEVATPRDCRLLAAGNTIATLLPGCAFHMGLQRQAPARELLDAGAAVSIATDFNPGTSPTCSMPMAMAIAVSSLKMTPAEALVAATINAAHALRMADQVGSLEPGKLADIAILDAGDYRELAYHFGVDLVETTLKRGIVIYRREKSPLWQDDL